MQFVLLLLLLLLAANVPSTAPSHPPHRRGALLAHTCAVLLAPQQHLAGGRVNTSEPSVTSEQSVA